MPIYAYRCSACGHSQDVLQKLSDPLLTTCPACGAEAYSKQVTAAGFQLKGSGWYVTDFRSNGQGQKPAAAAGDAAAKPETGDAKTGDAKAESASSGAKPAADAKAGDGKSSGGGTTPASTPTSGS